MILNSSACRYDSLDRTVNVVNEACIDTVAIGVRGRLRRCTRFMERDENVLQDLRNVVGAVGGGRQHEGPLASGRAVLRRGDLKGQIQYGVKNWSERRRWVETSL